MVVAGLQIDFPPTSNSIVNPSTYKPPKCYQSTHIDWGPCCILVLTIEGKIHCFVIQLACLITAKRLPQATSSQYQIKLKPFTS